MTGTDQIFLKIFQPCGEARTAHACFKSEHCVRQCAENRYPIQRVEVVVRMNIAEIDGEGCAIIGGFDA